MKSFYDDDLTEVLKQAPGNKGSPLARWQTDRLLKHTALRHIRSNPSTFGKSRDSCDATLLNHFYRKKYPDLMGEIDKEMMTSIPNAISTTVELPESSDPVQ